MFLCNHEQSQSPQGVRKQLINVLKNDGTPESKGFQDIPDFKSLKKHMGGVSTSWVGFFNDIQLDGLDLEVQMPVFDPKDFEYQKFGLYFAVEDNIITFKLNKDDIGVFIFTGSGKMKVEDLDNSNMTLERLFI